MTDLDGLDQSIKKFKDTVNALEQIKKVNSSIIETQKIVYENSATIKSYQSTIKDTALLIEDTSNKLIKSTDLIPDKIGGYLEVLANTNKQLTDTVRNYGSSVDNSVDEIRQQNSNNARETRTNFNEAAQSTQAKLAELQISFASSVAKIEFMINEQKNKNIEINTKLDYIKKIMLTSLALSLLLGAALIKGIYF